VLYEMVAGRKPFDGGTISDVIALILGKEPPLLARYSQDVPAELERIATKALTKDREERYQTAKDMLIDLKRLKQRMEVQAELERTGQSGWDNRTALLRAALNPQRSPPSAKCRLRSANRPRLPCAQLRAPSI